MSHLFKLMSNSGYIISFNQVRQTLQDLGKFSDSDLSVFTSHLKASALPADFLLLREGKVCQSFFFVERGSFRQYQINGAGEEVTQNLYVENDWVLDYKSLTSQTPSTCTIEAKEESEVLELGL